MWATRFTLKAPLSFLPQRCLLDWMMLLLAKCHALDHFCDDTQPLPIADIPPIHLELRVLAVDKQKVSSKEASRAAPGKSPCPVSLVVAKCCDDVQCQGLNLHQTPKMMRISSMNEMMDYVGERTPTLGGFLWPSSFSCSSSFVFFGVLTVSTGTLYDTVCTTGMSYDVQYNVVQCTCTLFAVVYVVQYCTYCQLRRTVFI
jgi:hypothetical protein